MSRHAGGRERKFVRALLVLLLAGAELACRGSSSTSPTPVVTSVSVEGGRDTLYAGETMQLSAAVELDSSMVIHTDTVSWTSTDTTKLTVGPTGLVTARAAGTASVIASVAGKSGQRGVLIRLVPVSSLTVSPGVRALYLGQSFHLTAVPKDSSGHPIVGRSPAWTSAAPSIASVDSTGLVTAHDTGTVGIRAVVEGRMDSAVVTVTIVPVVSVVILPGGDTVVLGDTLRPVAIPEDSAGVPVPGRTVRWTVSDSSALVPTGDGRFVAVTEGGFALTASSGQVSRTEAVLVASCADTVLSAVNAFRFPLSAGLLPRDPSSTIDAGSVSTTPVFYGGGILFGTDSGHMVVAYDPRGDVGDGTKPAGVCVLNRGSGVMYTTAKVRPVAGEGSPAGLRVVQETFASSMGPDSDFVLFRFTFLDTAATPIVGLRVGYFVDWDLSFDGDPSQDILRYYAGLGYAEAEEADTITHPQRLAIVPLGPSGTPTFGGWVNGGTPADPVNRGGYFARLVSGTETSPIGPQDIRQLVGMGPYTVPARGRLVVYFALVAGATQSAFAANRSAAIAWANSLGFH